MRMPSGSVKAWLDPEKALNVSSHALDAWIRLRYIVDGWKVECPRYIGRPLSIRIKAKMYVVDSTFPQIFWNFVFS